MTPPVGLLLLWIAFGGSHVAMSSLPVRGRLIGALGLRGFKGLYTLVAVATFLSLFAFYWGHRHEGTLLFYPQPWSRHVTETMMAFAVLFLVLANTTPRPGTTASDLRTPVSPEPRGIHRITRHPTNTAFGLFGIAHLLPNATSGDWTFWGGFVLFSILSAWHQDRRLLASGPNEYRAFHEATSFVPFAAIADGRQRLVLSEFRPAVVLAALIVFGAIRLAHPFVIGGFGH